jgi:hypothetical protein
MKKNFRPAWDKTASTFEDVVAASIALKSTLSDVVSVLAHHYKDKIYYRVQDDVASWRELPNRPTGVSRRRRPVC